MIKQITFGTKFSPNGNRRCVRVNCDNGQVWTEVGTWTPDIIIASRQLTKFIDHLRVAGKVPFCTEPDVNGNFFLFDIDFVNETYEKGYCYRLANRADNVVAPRGRLHNLEEALKRLDFKKVN